MTDPRPLLRAMFDAALAALPLELLTVLTAPTPLSLDALRRWGLRTIGEFAALPPDEVAARMGQAGVGWQRLAWGEDPRPLVPTLPVLPVLFMLPPG